MTDDGIGSIGAKIWPHIIELRQRFIYCVFAFLIVFVACYLYAAKIYGFLVKPLADIMSQSPGDARKMIYTGLTEAFFTYVKVSFWAAFFIFGLPEYHALSFTRSGAIKSGFLTVPIFTSFDSP